MKHTQSFVPLVEVTRGPLVESIHHGAVTVVDTAGKLLFSLGNPDSMVFLRSSAKPFQALPLIEVGGIDRYQLTDKEVALICSSHSGTDEHVAALIDLQAKIGIAETNLMCGVHPPYHEPTYHAMLQRGEALTQNRHDCAGKHTGMLAMCKMQGWSEDNYLDPTHPLQQLLIRTFGEMCSLKFEDIPLGIDGCSAPVFAAPLRNAALAYARLCDPKSLDAKRAAACQRITDAMAKHPDMVGGPGRYDTALMIAGAGKWVAKEGAEGYLAIGLQPGVLSPQSPGIGITITIADGDLSGRARPTVAVEVLRQLGLLSSQQVDMLKKQDARPLLNWRGLTIGEIRPCFQLIQ
jgi:L-asparaginase II